MPPATDPTLTLDSLLRRAQALSASLAAFAAHQAQARPAPEDAAAVELRPLQRLVQAELKSLGRVAAREEDRAVLGPGPGEGDGERNGTNVATPAQDLADSDADEGDDITGRNPAQSISSATTHALRSSNLGYLEATWGAAGAWGQVLGFQRRYPLRGDKGGERTPQGGMRVRKKAGLPRQEDTPSAGTSTGTSTGTGQDTPESTSTAPKKGDAASKAPEKTARVDIVARDGRVWLKVSTVTEKRLLFERAREGWTSSDEEDEDDSDDDDAKVKDGTKISALADNGAASSAPSLSSSSDSSDEDPSESRSLPRTAQYLVRAAAHVWADYAHPRVVFILPYLPAERDANRATRTVLAHIRRAGAEAVCGPAALAAAPEPDEADEGGKVDDSKETAPPAASPAAGEAEAAAALYAHLLPSAHPRLTPHVTLDCTVLLALISDVSHRALAPGKDFHPAINRQIARELERPLLPSVLYPALAGYVLHASRTAVVRCAEIVEMIGTEGEKKRMELLLAIGDGAALTPEARTQQWRDVSAHDTPPELLLPVAVEEDTADGMPALLQHVLATCDLSPLNRAVWTLGWTRGWTIVSSNRVAAGRVESCVEQILAEEEKAQAGRRRGNGARAAEATRLEATRLDAEEQEVEATQQEAVTQRENGEREMAALKLGENGASQAEATKLHANVSREGGATTPQENSGRRGPRVWVVGTARSLVKKERGLRG